MKQSPLYATAAALLAEGKGLLAMDESNPTCNKRFAARGIPQDPETRRAYRQLIVSAPHLGDSISGAILFDETIRQKTDDGTPMAQALQRAGIVPGIKLDEGAKDLAFFPGEKVTEGLDGLRGRLKEYKQFGARFAKWRAVIAIGSNLPTDECLKANAHALARYAALCQEAEVLPIVEPEVLMDGDHTLAQCYDATRRALHALFAELYRQRIDLRGTILKPNMVVAGLDCPQQPSVDEVAEATIECFREVVPPAVPGIAFLSGGQEGVLATQRLNAMNARYRGKLPWVVTFSYSRAIQEPALDAWKGQADKVVPAQRALEHRARANSAARRGEYSAATEA